MTRLTVRGYLAGQSPAAARARKLAGQMTRLSLQHSVWRADAAAAWQRAGFAPGQSIVDVGCRPGFATLDLAELVGRRGRVLAVDQSERFLAHLRQMAAAHADAADARYIFRRVQGTWQFERDEVDVFTSINRFTGPRCPPAPLP